MLESRDETWLNASPFSGLIGAKTERTDAEIASSSSSPLDDSKEDEDDEAVMESVLRR